MKVAMNPSKVTPIQTKYIITNDKSILSTMEIPVDLKKGDIVQGVSVITSGDVSNDSGHKYLVFNDKKGNSIRVETDYRGFVPFFEEYKEKEKADIVNEQTFLQKHKNHLIIAFVLVAGYFAYKKFKK